MARPAGASPFEGVGGAVTRSDASGAEPDAPERSTAGATSGSEAAALAAAAVALLGFLYAALHRVAWPLPLEWMENGSLEHLRRVLAGEPLFVAPSLEFVPFPYPPLYYWLSAPVALGIGSELIALRAVSIAAVLGSLPLLARWVQRETGSWVAGALAAGLFVASYRASGGYMDVARIDSLFTLLVLATLYVLRFAERPAGFVVAALLGTACIMTKQTTAVVLAPMVLWCAWRDHREAGADWRRWRRFPAFGVVLFVLSLGATAWLEWRDGHFLLHVLGAQQSHGIRWWVLGWFLRSDLLGSLPIAALGCLALAVFRPRGRDLSFYGAALAGLLVAALIPRIKVSGALNNLLPVHAALALGAGLAFAWLPRQVEDPARRSRLATFLCWAAIAQLAALAYDPRASLPPARAEAVAQRLVERLRVADGEVYLPAHGALAALAGKRMYAHQMPVADFAKSGHEPEAAELAASFEAALRERRFEVVVDSHDRFLERYPEPGLLARYYRAVGPAVEEPALLAPIEGYPVRPGAVWVPRRATAP